MPWHKDEFAEVFRIWANYHRLIFDMNGRQKEGVYLTATWQDLFRAQMNPLPTAAELKEASQWMIGDEVLSKTPWASHYAFIKGRINRSRRFEADAWIKEKERERRQAEERIVESENKKQLEIARNKVFKSA